MRILLTAWHRPVTVHRSIYWALRELGHDVTTAGAIDNELGWANGRRFECFEWQPHVELVCHQDDPERWVPRTPGFELSGFDLVLQMDRFVGGDPGCRNVLWGLDNHVGQYSGHAAFDHIYLGHSWGHMRELVQSSFLPAGYDPAYQYLIDPRAERPIDVLLLGAPYTHRVEFVAELRALGVNVTAYSGPAWQEYNALYNQAKIALVVSNCGDLSGRVFEHLAQGCLVVADVIPDMEKVGLRKFHHYVQYTNVEDCAELIKDALGHPNLLASMALAGHEAGKPHTWQARLETILGECG